MQAIVQDNNAGARRDRGLRGKAPVARDETGRDAGEQQRFVADRLGRVHIGVDGDNAGAARAAIATRQKRDAFAHPKQQTGDRNGGRRLAGAAGDKIANANDGNLDA